MNMLKNRLRDMCFSYNVVVRVDKDVSNLSFYGSDEFVGNVSVILMVILEDFNYNGCVGLELYKYIFIKAVVFGVLVIFIDSLGECGNFIWEKSESKG